MKLPLIILILFMITSCGKKGDASSRVTPLLPASEFLDEKKRNPFEEVAKDPSSLEDYGMRFLPSSPLPQNVPAIICFNTETLNHQKVARLEELLETTDELLSYLYSEAIRALEDADPDSRFCPKIYLAISL
jgi:hypothetical protein